MYFFRIEFKSYFITNILKLKRILFEKNVISSLIVIFFKSYLKVNNMCTVLLIMKLLQVILLLLKK